MTDTPRTDEYCKNFICPEDGADLLPFAQELERENARLVSCLSDSVKWVSVEERVPTDDSSVIVHLHGGARTVGVWSGGAWYNQKCRAFVSLGENVTHWMPLPEAPK